MVHLRRDALIHGVKPSLVMAHATFARMMGLLPLVESYQTILVRNIPKYSPRGTYDGVMTVEYETQQHPSQPGKRVRVPKFFRLVVLNVRLFPVPSSGLQAACPVESLDTSLGLPWPRSVEMARDESSSSDVGTLTSSCYNASDALMSSAALMSAQDVLPATSLECLDQKLPASCTQSCNVRESLPSAPLPSVIVEPVPE